jgi:NAD(P)-dependent dehydrogenase (short-subunit alcohol dehydrogenase family)
VSDPDSCTALVQAAMDELGRVDVLVNNAAFQMSHDSLDEISDDEWDHTLATNLTTMFILCKDAVPHMRPGSSIINSSSVNSDMPSPTLAPYAMTKAGIANFTASLAQLLGEKGIRANSVAPGPIWTPLIPSAMSPDQVEGVGEQTPVGRPGQPAELAPVFVMLASDEASYVIGARVRGHRRDAHSVAGTRSPAAEPTGGDQNRYLARPPVDARAGWSPKDTSRPISRSPIPPRPSPTAWASRASCTAKRTTCRCPSPAARAPRRS